MLPALIVTPPKLFAPVSVTVPGPKIVTGSVVLALSRLKSPPLVSKPSDEPESKVTRLKTDAMSVHVQSSVPPTIASVPPPMTSTVPDAGSAAGLASSSVPPDSTVVPPLKSFVPASVTLPLTSRPHAPCRSA